MPISPYYSPRSLTNIVITAYCTPFSCAYIHGTWHYRQYTIRYSCRGGSIYASSYCTCNNQKSGTHADITACGQELGHGVARLTCVFLCLVPICEIDFVWYSMSDDVCGQLEQRWLMA
ncbi:uncharacterized protein K460DRAFT_365096 [Cucurbitaria berberidis CBS 394.84]|uniref:Uncharacterized protein n=1 Tax=Cucurbitaria berberidis CBS 394.84 TaxID=1168544 RepID=A0A9P4LBL7_9PLEO|nr:uncharacterized protein K460DRAFT_365096 [Cucurbitaria berberidis CBS 394.84]KAF1849185.1 hypothetical protein K460DRAFT_365096 [Cucurbitaria berberidis CBS 394.84]